MKLAAFDLEISRQVPAGTQDLKRYAPLGISCAAVAFSDRDEITLWQAVPQLARAECQALVAALQMIVRNGYTLVTWNGCAFDFFVLAQESGLLEACGDLALDHVDLMLMVTFMKGHFLSLEKALQGAGLPGKLRTVTLSTGATIQDMDGVLAPKLWAAGEHEAVLQYLRADVGQLLQLAQAVQRHKVIRWLSNTGKPQFAPFLEPLPVWRCFSLPEPDTSWMRRPPRREQFVDWIPGWRERIARSSPG